MKFHSFHLMPYPELPSDIGRSVCVDIDSALFDPSVGHRAYNDYLDQLELAARVGFDGICVNEHHSSGYGLMPSPNLMAATLARNTTGASLVILGNSIALYNPPIRVAEELAMLDVISGGRVIAGFPVGTPMDVCYSYGIDPATLRERYYEAHDLIVKAWTRPETFAFNGRHTKLRYVNTWPRPLQDPHPPIWIPGAGSVDTWEFCARMDYNYSYLSYFGYQAAQATMDGFWSKMRALGKAPNPYQAGFIQFVGLAETDAEAYDIYRGPAEYFYNRTLHVHSGFASPPGHKSEETVRARLTGQIEAAAKMSAGPRQASMNYRRMVDEGWVLVGSPATVAEKLSEVGRRLNVGQMMVLLHFGNMKNEVARHNIEMFGKYVIPELRHEFDDVWEDSWAPRKPRAGGGNSPVDQPSAARAFAGAAR
jgi:alkanesulfonate monooxygenase SsuD/methylene tetrahydromethanopterin reductase-like flavin-dependent oxidoreductase (luciferase family)